MSHEISVSSHPDGCSIEVWVVPGAARTEISGRYDRALRVRVAAPPEGGRANEAVAALLQEVFRARGAYLDGGIRSRRKRYVIIGREPGDVARLVRKIAAGGR